MSSYSSFNDNDLISLLKEGDEPAFAEIYNRYWKKLYYIAHRNLKSAEASEEIVQEVFLLLWRKKSTLNILHLSVYLAAMVRYAVYHYLAKEKQVKKHEENLQRLYAKAIIEEADIESRLLLEIVTRLSNQLPEKCRLVFQYNKLQDQSLTEVAKQLNISQKTAEAHLTKALKIIRAKLGSSFNILF